MQFSLNTWYFCYNKLNI